MLEDNDNAVYLIVSKVHFVFKYKQYDIIFSFNNKLHDHIKKSCLKSFKKTDIIIIKTRKLLIEANALRSALQKISKIKVIDKKRL